MTTWELLQYNVETWNLEDEVWECRYKSTPSYQYRTKVRKVGHLWWKGEVEEQVVINDKTARKRALSRAIRRADSLLKVDVVRIVMVVTNTKVAQNVRKLIWAGGEFVI